LHSVEFRLAVAEIELRRPDLRGLRVRDVATLGAWRKTARLGWSRISVLNLLGAVLNVVVVSGEAFPWSLLNVAAGMFSTSAFLFCESRYRATGRQLNRLATEQIVRDLWGDRS
jgi:hypothetical protein